MRRNALAELGTGAAQITPPPTLRLYCDGPIISRRHYPAIDWLDRAYRKKDVGMIEIVGEPLFKNLANDPRYKARESEDPPPDP